MDKLLFIKELDWSTLVDGVLSDKKYSTNEVSKIKLRLVMLKNEKVIQVTEYIDKKVIHTNMPLMKIGQYIYEKNGDFI